TELGLDRRLREHQAVVDVRALGFGDEHFGKLLKRLDRRLRVLLGDVLEHRAAEPLGVGFSCDGDDLAREDEPTHRDGERERQNENRLAVPTHTVPPYYFNYRSEEHTSELQSR